MSNQPTPFEVHESGVLFHGTKSFLSVGDLLVAGRGSTFEDGRISNHVYVTATLDAATVGAELAAGEGPGRIYIVEPTGIVEEDPNVTDKKFPGNPTRSYRTREPVEVVGELVDLVGHSPEQLQTMQDGLAELKRQGLAVIYDSKPEKRPIETTRPTSCHVQRRQAAPSTCSNTSAFSFASASSSVGTERAVIPPPVPIVAPSGSITIERMTIARSTAPSKPTYPKAPE